MLCAAHGSAFSQSLPTPTRTIYKCKINGKLAYSDEPCLGAERLEVEPTRGVNKLSGKERVGADVRHELWRENFAGALHPITGMDARQLDARARRQKLDGQAQGECARMDRLLYRTEEMERTAGPNDKPEVQRDLLVMRKRFRDLRC